MSGQAEGQANGGRRGRDAALTWEVPPPFEAAAEAAAAGRPAFAAVAGRHLEALVAQLLNGEGVAEAAAWGPRICELAQAAAAALSPTAAAATGRLDPRHYIKVKRVLTVGASPADSLLVYGVACRKSLAHKRMRSSIAQPRVMLLAGGIEVARSSLGSSGAAAKVGAASGGSGMASLGSGLASLGSSVSAGAVAGAQSKLSSFDSMLDQEQQYLDAVVDRIASFNPDVLLVEGSVARYAQELLLSRDISLVLNVKPELLERIARCTGAQVAPSPDQLSSHCVGFCKEFEVESIAAQQAQQPSDNGIGTLAAPASAAASTEPSPRTPEAPDAQHLLASEAPLRRAATFGAAPRALMTFRGCPRPLGATLVLRGSDAAELRKVKRVASFATYAAFWGVLESAMLANQLGAAAAAVLPGSGSGSADSLAGLADAVASTSYLATAEARGRQAILSASPHVSVVLERGTAHGAFDLPNPVAEPSAAAAAEAAAAGAAGAEESPPESPASSDSTNMWVLPAEAGTATFTVSGSQTEGDEEQQGALQWQAVQAGKSGTSTPRGQGPLSQAVPGSPQDPLHMAAKELALQQLRLTGSEAASPVAGSGLSGGSGEPGAAQQPGGTQQAAAQLAHLRRDSAGAAALSQAASPPTGLAADASAASAERGGGCCDGGGGGPASPALAAYRMQRLWLAISCKNPAKGILCEPSHAHCMEFYADSDLPLAAFMSAAAPPHRKCPHPQCGEGAPLHLRSFMHGDGLVTLSSMRLPAGRELPDGRVWLWLRPCSDAGAGPAAPSATRRVPLSPEAACLSFAHLLSLLLDCRHLSLGGLSLQRDFVRYLGAGQTLLCLHYSAIHPYRVCMPPRQVQLAAEPELEWLQEELKQLTEEADEAFSAIEYALTQQLDALERQMQAQQAEAEGQAAEGQTASGDGGADPEFRAMWLGTLADTRAAFLDMVQDAVALLDGSPHGVSCGCGSGEQAARRVTSTVWELNRLRSMLAAVVVQWATCLHEGSPGSHAAPPASALSTALASRRLAAGHSRHASLEVLPPREGPAHKADEQAETPALPLGQHSNGGAKQQQQQPAAAALSSTAGQDQPGAMASEPLPLPRLPLGPASASLAGRQLRRERSDSSLAHQFLEAATALPPASLSELNFGAPSLVGGDDPGDGSPLGSPTSAAQPQSQGRGQGQATIPTGLVARYVALFDQRGSSSGPGSGGASPSGPRLRSQRTQDWVQSSAQQGADAAGDAAAGSGADMLAASGAAQGASERAGSSDQQATAQPPLQGPQHVQQAQWQRRPPFRLDLSNPDPELVRALTPKLQSSTEEAEPEAAPYSSRLEQVAARLGRMSLSKSFTERRRSYQHLAHSLSADQASFRQQLPPPDEAAAVAVQQLQQPAADQQAEQRQTQIQGVQQGPSVAAAAGVAVAGGEQPPPLPSEEPSGRGSVSHWEWNSLLDVSASPEEPGGTALGEAAEAATETEAAGERPAGGSALSKPLGPLRMLQSAASGRLEAIARLQEAPMPPALAAAGSDAAAEANGEATAAGAAAAVEAQAASGEQAAAAAPAAAAGAAEAPAAAAAPSSRASMLLSTSLGPLGTLMSSVASQLPGSSAISAHPAPPGGQAAAGKLPAKQPSKLLQLLGKLRSELAPGHVPLTAGRVELSGRALLPGGADGMRVAIFDDEPTSIIAYFLATKEYQGYLHDSVAGILFGQPGADSAAPGDGSGSSAVGAAESEPQAAALPASWQSLPDSPRGIGTTRSSSLVPGLQAKQPAAQQRQQAAQQQGAVALAAGAAAAEPAPPEDMAYAAQGALNAEVAAAVAAAPDAPAAVGAGQPAAGQQQHQQQQVGAQPTHSTSTVTQEELAAEQSGDWQVLFCEQQLDCQLAMEDPSPGMPWGRARFQVTAYYAPQFAELRRRVVAGGEAAFLASISRCRKWASRGGKSAVYFARTHDKRYIIKQLSRSERQSFLEFAPDYFRYVATMLHRGQETCLAKILGVYQVSVQYTGGRGAPTAPPFGGKEGVMDLLITENVFYGRDAQVSRVFDLKGSQRDRYAADDPMAAGAVLLDENLKELNLAAPTLVGPRAFARLQRALWSDSGFLAGLGVMDYSLLVGVDKPSGELVVGVIDYIRQYTWDKQVETWVKKTGILGGAGKDPTVISPKQYSRRFRVAMSSYLTVVPAWEAPAPPLDADAV